MLSALLRSERWPECVVVETSLVADPAYIVRNLMDPVIWRETALSVVDVSAPAAALDELFPAADELIAHAEHVTLKLVETGKS